MSRRLLHWNGADLPAELAGLPAGTYVLEAVEVSAPLTEEEDEGLAAALASVRSGHSRELGAVRAAMDAKFSR